jgi:hypothetical protein
MTTGEKAAKRSVKDEILDHLSEVESVEYRILLTMMLKMQSEYSELLSNSFALLQAQLAQIQAEISRIQKSEDELKRIVLNGHASVHDDDHEWIREKRRLDEACGKLISSHTKEGLCEHAKAQAEKEAVTKKRLWDVGDKVAGTVATALVMFVLGLVIAKLFPHLMGP